MSPMVLAIIGGAVAFLAVATAIGAVLEARAATDAARATTRNLNARTRSWWVMVCVLGGAILLGKTAVIVLFGFLSWRCANSGR